MPPHQRNGKRSHRNVRIGSVQPKQCRHFLIVTDAKETEQNYISGLQDALSSPRLKITIKQENTQANLVKECLRIANLEVNLKAELWILFDCDNVAGFDNIITNAQDNNIGVAWSNPCIEIWFLAYFGNIPQFTQATQCIDELKNVYYNKTHAPYRKNDRDIYRRLYRYGDEEKATNRMGELVRRYERDGIPPSMMAPGSKIYLLVKAIREAANDSSIPPLTP